ncbi:MAG: M23 family metallopeptidase [Chitinispirillaceae bacterium]|nr:M23 family metallopeptidase [Chitinispirillaceae bacterium]
MAFTQAQIVYLIKRHEHEGLINKIASFERYFSKENKKLNDIVRMEDHTRLAYGLDPISADVRKVGIGGHPSAAESITESVPYPIVMKAYAVQESLSILLRKARLQNSTFDQMGEHVERISTFWAQRPSICPAAGRVTSPFGYRIDPVYGTRLHHDGIDIANEIGTPVVASADGVVKEALLQPDFGRVVVLEHPETNLLSIYAHLSNFTVTRGQWVRRGELIAFMGNSGKSTGPHLHYEIRRNGQPVNSARFILPTDYVID